MELNLNNFNIRQTKPNIFGNIALPKNTERYIVKEQGLLGIDIFSGDKIQIINTEGGQVCEVIVFDNTGKNKQSIIGKKINGDAKFIKYVLTNSNDTKILLDKLKKKKIDFNKTKSSNFFDHTTLVRETLDLVTQEDGFIIFAAPGEDMQVDQQNAPTDIEVIIEKNNNKQNH